MIRSRSGGAQSTVVAVLDLGVTFPLWVHGTSKVGTPPQVNVMGTLVFALGMLLALVSWLMRGGGRGDGPLPRRRGTAREAAVVRNGPAGTMTPRQAAPLVARRPRAPLSSGARGP